MEAVEVPDEGHVPALAGKAMLGRIEAFAATCDKTAARAGTGTPAATVVAQPSGVS
jgi:hypothetical protein